MADKIWIGTDGVWTTAGNWSPSGVPASSDDVYIVSGSDDITGSDQSAVTLGRLVVGQQFTGSIGTNGTKLQINATNFDYSGTGPSTYIEGTFATLTVQNTSTEATALNLSGDSDTITTLRILGGRGTINVASSCNIVTTIEQIGAEGVTTNIADSTTIGGSCTLTMDSGKFELNQAVPTITIFGGELEAILDTGTVTTLEQYGGRVRWKPTASCTLTTLTLYSGLFDSRDSTAPEFTVTNTTVHENGVIDERSGLENATWTNPIAMEGGEVRYDSGRSVTIS
jgi:hypothetical protein